MIIWHEVTHDNLARGTMICCKVMTRIESKDKYNDSVQNSGNCSSQDADQYLVAQQKAWVTS